jgi:hypothetical protein
MAPLSLRRKKRASGFLHQAVQGHYSELSKALIDLTCDSTKNIKAQIVYETPKMEAEAPLKLKI